MKLLSILADIGKFPPKIGAPSPEASAHPPYKDCTQPRLCILYPLFLSSSFHPVHVASSKHLNIWKSHPVFCDSHLRDCPFSIEVDIRIRFWCLLGSWHSLTELFQNCDTGNDTHNLWAVNRPMDSDVL